MSVEQQFGQLYALRLDVAHNAPWQQPINVAHRQPIHASLGQSHQALWSLHGSVRSAHAACFSASSPLLAGQEQRYDVLDHNPVYLTWSGYWDLTSSPGLLALTPELLLVHQGVERALLTVTLECDQSHGLWLAELTLAEPGDFLALTPGDPLSVTVNGESFALVVVEKRSKRLPDALQLTVQAASPAVQWAEPLAAPLGRIWTTTQLASTVVTEALGSTVAWQMTDWLLRGERLDATLATPWVAARAVVQAAGGVLESLADGALRARPRFPVAPREWSSATPEHIFTDASDHLELTLRHHACSRVNSVTVYDTSAEQVDNSLLAELDRRPEGLNQGITRFATGERAAFLVTSGQGVVVSTPQLSAGELHQEPSQTVQFTEEAIFSNTFSARLARPALTVNSVEWIGANLGTITLGGDGRTLSILAPGVGVARVTYTVLAQGYSVTPPVTVDGQPYVVRVVVDGVGGETGRVARVTRHNGDHAGQAIQAPLAIDLQALRARGEAELDSLTTPNRLEVVALHRPGLQPGQLLELHDGLHHTTWRGQLLQVRHEISSTHAVSHLTIIAS